jgi:hypothetical protein
MWLASSESRKVTARSNALLIRRKIRHVVVIGHAMARNLVPGLVHERDGFASFFHRMAVGTDGGADLVAVSISRQMPTAPP